MTVSEMASCDIPKIQLYANWEFGQKMAFNTSTSCTCYTQHAACQATHNEQSNQQSRDYIV